MSNSLMVIFPYKHEEMWVFDDESVGLNKEPFVAGIPDMINAFIKDIPNAEGGFALVFSHQPFPGFKAELIWQREQYGGHWYLWDKMGQEGWLCPALFKYFDRIPAKIYCDARASQP